VAGDLVYVTYIVEMTAVDDFRKCDRNSIMTPLEWILGFQSGPQATNIGNFEPSSRPTTDRNDCGQVSGDPNGDVVQSWVRIKAPTLPPPIKKSNSAVMPPQQILPKSAAFLTR